MRSDGFAFAVRVRGEIDGVRVAGELLQAGNNFLFAGDDDVFGLEVVLYIHAERTLGQIFDVPERGLNGVAFAQILLNGFRLGRRFDDDESFWQMCPQIPFDGLEASMNEHLLTSSFLMIAIMLLAFSSLLD